MSERKTISDKAIIFSISKVTFEVFYLTIINIILNRTHSKQFLLYCDLTIKQHYYDLSQDTALKD